MDMQELLKNKVKQDYWSQLIATLQQVQEGALKHDKLTPNAAKAGLILLNQMPDYVTGRNSYPSGLISYGDARYNFFLEFLGEKQWEQQEQKQLLEFLFGEQLTPLILYAWEQERQRAYMRSYYRRSFRAPHDIELYFPNQLNFLQLAVRQAHYAAYYSDPRAIFYDLTLPEQVIYNHQLKSIGNMTAVWAAALDNGDETLYQTFEDIIFNKHPEGKVTRPLIQALLMSNQERCWQLVEKLLLAAQRQEGLRQTITEAMDECSLGALKHLMKVILDEKLYRFSGVVRALDVWAGLLWQSEKDATVKTFFEKGYQYLADPSQIPAAIKSSNNADVYMALWAQGAIDVHQTLPYLAQLLEKGSSEKQCLALFFGGQTGHFYLNMPLYYAVLDSNDLAVLGAAVAGINSMLTTATAPIYAEAYPALFDRLHGILERIHEKEKTFEGKVFSWSNITFSRNQVMAAMAALVLDSDERLNTLLRYFDEMEVSLRERITRIVLPVFSDYNWDHDANKKNADYEVTPFQRNYALRLLKDRGEFNVTVAFRVLGKVVLTMEEAAQVADILKRKGATMRSKAIELLLKQQDDTLIATTGLLLDGDTEQRLGGLDIAVQLKKSDRLLPQVSQWATAFGERKKISPKEQILLTQLTSNTAENDLVAENGYGLYNPANLTEAILPPVDPASPYEKLLAKNAFGFSMPAEKIRAAYASLYQVFQDHASYEYEAETYQNEKHTYILGNNFTRTKPYGYKFASREEEYLSYPLPEVWDAWFKASGLTALDLFIVSRLVFESYHELEESYQAIIKDLPLKSDVMPEEVLDKYPYKHHNPLFNITNVLLLRYQPEDINTFLIGGCIRLFHSIPPDMLKKPIPVRSYGQTSTGKNWQAVPQFQVFLEQINYEKLEGDNIRLCWHIYRWRQLSSLPDMPGNFPVPLELICKAYEAGVINADDLFAGIIHPEYIRALSKKKTRPHEVDYATKYPFVKPKLDRIREAFLDVELKRGDTPTTVSLFVQSLQVIYGVKRFTGILHAMGKTNLHRGYLYSYDNTLYNKTELFSTLLKRCQPLPEDTQEAFNAGVKAAGITEQRLVEAAVYAPQWQKFVSAYLGWKGLDSAIWWMHAHTKNSGANEQNAEAESEIARYSEVDLQDFKDGAVDKEWFLKARKELGKERWQLVYDAAKYISDGNAHRRARLYADVMTGDLKIKEVTAKVKDTRDQDYLRMYGLIPLAKSNPAKDVLSRYAYLQQFLKETRQWGAQKQASEKLAYRIAMENLARNAGYADPQRLAWAMETRQVQEILASNTQVQFDDTLIGLVVQDDGLAEVVAYKGDKPLKAIPPKYKKDKKILELQEYRKTLREQFSRSRQALEEAMVKADNFTLEEVTTLFAHPVISKHLENLVFISNGHTGFWRSGELADTNGKAYTPTANDEIRIAHCADLHSTGLWSAYQHYCFTHQLQQPFKQIFRELYLPLEEELKEVSISRRYAGHQVQPSQAVALLKTRGWKVNYEEGLQKVYHKQGFVAKLYAMADWFSPAEVESPTLETIQFHDLKTYENVAFKDIPPHIFSEVMRDIDLVVSVAHVGGVDPEASHSSIEMRAVLLKESARLFKLDNVTVKGNHAFIKGKYGEYTVHLGSAVVHQLPGNYLSILPVHSQHRGRIFLPFADEDPRSAELVSKVLLLARDQEIQDPTILRQLQTA